MGMVAYPLYSTSQERPGKPVFAGPDGRAGRAELTGLRPNVFPWNGGGPGVPDVKKICPAAGNR